MRSKSKFYEALAEDCIKTNRTQSQDIGDIVADMEKRMNDRIDEANKRVIEKVEQMQNQALAPNSAEEAESVVENNNENEEDNDNENN